MDRFKNKQFRLLVATDVAARGIDVSDLSHVINYNLPDQNGVYTHRSGRTGRAQKSGVSISILISRDLRKIKELERIINKKFEYKKIPNGEDVLQKQIENFIKTNGNEKYFSEIANNLKKINKDDLLKYFIVNKFSRFIDAYKNSQDLNASDLRGDRREGSGDNVSLKINFGKKQGMDIKGLFALFNSNKKLKGIKIGKIDLMPEYSVFSVEKKDAEKVMNLFKKFAFKGKQIEITKSNEVASYSSKRKSNSRSRFDRRGNRNEKGNYPKKRSSGPTRRSRSNKSKRRYN